MPQTTSRLSHFTWHASFFLLLWGAALATHFSGLVQPMHCDYSTRVRVARDWSGGQQLYVETYCNTQPLVYHWLLLIDSARPERSCYLAETLLAAASGTLLRAALVRTIPRAALFAPLILVAAVGTSETFYGGQIVEGPGLWCDVACVAALGLACRRNPRAWSLLAGLLAVALASFRIPAIVHLFGYVLWLWCNGPLTRRRFLTIASCFLFGLMAAIGVLVGHAAWSGIAAGWFDVLARNVRYGSLARVPFRQSLWEGGKVLCRLALGQAPLATLVCVSLGGLVGRCVRRRSARVIVFGLAWSGLAVVGAFPGGRHYPHYYHFIWPGLALAAAAWIQALPKGRTGKSLSSRLATALAVGIVGLAILGQAYRGAALRRDYLQGTHEWNSIERAAAFIQAEVPPDVPVLVNLWGNPAELYWKAPRPAPSFPVPHVVPRDLYGQFVTDILNRPPRFVVTDSTPWQPIDVPASPLLTSSIEQLIEWDYDLIFREGAIKVFRRRPDAQPIGEAQP
jgi:hypothetical protein